MSMKPVLLFAVVSLWGLIGPAAESMAQPQAARGTTTVVQLSQTIRGDCGQAPGLHCRASEDEYRDPETRRATILSAPFRPLRWTEQARSALIMAMSGIGTTRTCRHVCSDDCFEGKADSIRSLRAPKRLRKARSCH